MPALRKTDFTAKLTWIGAVADNAAGIRSAARQEAALTFAGLEGDCHSGTTRASCVRVTDQYPKGTEIRNTRQLSVLSAEDLADIAREIGLETLAPELLGATLVIEGIPDLTHVPPSSRLQFASGATIVVDMENRPCHLPAREIEADSPGHGKAFRNAAQGKRGVTAWVERPGPIHVGDQLTLHIPDQPLWPHLDAAWR